MCWPNPNQWCQSCNKWPGFCNGWFPSDLTRQLFWLVNMDYRGLVDILHRTYCPMIVSCHLEKPEYAFHHIIRICPKICQKSDSFKMLLIRIVEGCHPENRPMELTKEIFYCCMRWENRIDSITDAIMLCSGTKLTKKLLMVHKCYENAADHLSSSICLKISKHAQIPSHLRKHDLFTNGEKGQLMKDLWIK